MRCMTSLTPVIAALALLAGCGDDGDETTTAADATTAAQTSTAAGTATSPPAAAPGKPSTLAVIGDVPYDDAQAEAFPALVKDIDGADVSAVVHLGDIKSSQKCSDEFLEQRLALYDAFDAPFVFTPGDNEWTDCHREKFGGYVPTERLAALRKLFYPQPEQALGGDPPLVVRPQSLDAPYADYVENVMWTQSDVVFSTVHVVGSNNDLLPWFGTETEEQTKLRTEEFDERLAADIAWLKRAFDTAREQRAPGVVIAMQANLFISRVFETTVTGFTKLVEEIAELAAGYDGEVLLLQGDTHQYLADKPLEDGSPEHDVTTKAPNVTRIVVQGETASEWLRLRVDPSGSKLFDWERVEL